MTDAALAHTKTQQINLFPRFRARLLHSMSAETLDWADDNTVSQKEGWRVIAGELIGSKPQAMSQ